MPKASRSIDIEVSADALMDIICDFESYPDFVDSVLSADVEWRERNRWRAVFEVVLLRRHVRYRLDLGRAANRLDWTLVDGDFMSRNDGGWDLRPLDEQTTRAVYTIDLDLEPLMPPAMTLLVIDATIPRMLRDFKRRAESLAGSTWEYE